MDKIISMIKTPYSFGLYLYVSLIVCGAVQAGQYDSPPYNNGALSGARFYTNTASPATHWPAQAPYLTAPSSNRMPMFQPLTQSPYAPSHGDIPAAYDRQVQQSIYTVRVFPLQGTIKLGGTVIPLKSVTFTAQIPGRVEYIAGSEGDYAEEGLVLVAIDDDDLLAQRRSAVAELSNADAVIRNAQVQYSREFISPQSRNINSMPGMGLPAMFDQFFTRNFGRGMGYGNPELDRHADLYSRGTDVNQAVARQLRARAKLDEVDARLRDTRSIAPFSGVIIKKLVEVGDTVQPGQAILELANTRNLQLMVDVPARLMPGIQIGMIVKAHLDIGDLDVHARVAQIFPVADSNRHTVTVKFDLPANIPGGPGMYAEVTIPNIRSIPRRVMVIPAGAVRPRGSLSVVYRLDNNNNVGIRYVRLGERLDAENIIVLSGLMDNDRIFVNPDEGIKALKDQAEKRAGSDATH